jgi:excisionase family DNA binding protein
MIPAPLTVNEAAHALGVHRRTIWRRIQSGDLPAVTLPGRSGKEYRIKEEDIKKYLEDHA